MKKLETENIKWKLEYIYSDIHDSQINRDVENIENLSKIFKLNYRGNLEKKIGESISDYLKIKMLIDKVSIYLFLQQSLDVGNEDVKKRVSEIDQKINSIYGEYITFYTLELVVLNENIIEGLCQKSEIVKKHKSWIDHQRAFRVNLLSEEVESALTKRSSFTSNAWSEFFDEYEADLRFDFKNEKRNLTEMLDISNNSNSVEERAEAMRLINLGFGGYFAKYSAQTLYVVAGEKAVEDRERKYKNPMELQNKLNNIPDEVVEALHTTVMEIAGPLAQRYYSIKAKLLGLKTLAWSDRNAPLPFSDTTTIPFSEAMDTVISAYKSFSPTLATIINNFVVNNKIDAPSMNGKRGGAFNCSFILPGNKVESFTLLNYLGSNRDVMTLAHELGHGVHGILAGEAQGPLMNNAPIAYCETASVFGEMTTFDFLKKQLTEKNNTEELLALLTRKIEDILNTVVRQIGFSNFERRIHGMDSDYKTWHEPKKLSVDELNKIWLSTLKELYGNDGEIFDYKNTEYLWSYVSHFHRPFYVYGYAFGELLTQSLYAQQSRLGDKFEPLYLDLLRSGSTKNVTELLKPFGINPSDKSFWAEGIKVGLEAMINEVEKISALLELNNNN